MQPLPIAYRLAASVPPGHSLLGFYPPQLFRLDSLELPKAAGVSIVRAGQHVPCDGRVHMVQGHERTLSLGGFIALHVHNDSDKPASFNAVLQGRAVDEPNFDSVLHIGSFVNEGPESQQNIEEVDPYGLSHLPPERYDEFVRNAPDEILSRLPAAMREGLLARRAELLAADPPAAPPPDPPAAPQHDPVAAAALAEATDDGQVETEVATAPHDDAQESDDAASGLWPEDEPESDEAPEGGIAPVEDWVNVSDVPIFPTSPAEPAPSDGSGEQKG